MENNARTAVLASFAADALALGVHWVYNTNVIDKKTGRVERFVKPFASFHAGREAGEFTHYGDQMLVLLETVAAAKEFELYRFATNWRALFNDYNGYVDKATKGTLANFEANADPSNAGSESDDLAGASRISPLVYRYYDNPDQLIASARSQTAMTHNHPNVIDAAEFFARVTLAVMDGRAPSEAMQAVSETHFKGKPLTDQIENGMASASADTGGAIADFGQACEIEMAFPGAIHLIAKYENDLKEALVQNVMAGGDSASRGMAVGMILGAYSGLDAIPKEWLDEMKHYARIGELLQKIDG